MHVTAGTHNISVTVEQKTERKTLECSEGKVLKVDFDDRFPELHGHGNDIHQPEVERYRPAGGWIAPLVVEGLGLVGVGLGIGFGLASQSAKSDAEALFAKGICANQSSAGCAPYKQKIDAERTDSTISVIGYVTGGVLIATGAVLFFAWPKAERQKAMLVPSVGPNSAALTLQGRF